MPTPFHCLSEASLTASGLLELDVADGEVELMRRSFGIELRCPVPPNENKGMGWIERNTDLQVTLTTHRLVFFMAPPAAAKLQARLLHLSNVQLVEAAGGASLLHWNSSYKLLLNTYTLGELVLVFRGANATKDRNDMLALLEKALERRAWETATRIQQKQITKASYAIAKRKVGVDAILAKNALRHKEAALLADTALSGDAEQLLQEATELITVIQKYVATLQKNANAANEDDATQSTLLLGMLQDMGMTSALTKHQLRGKNDREYYQLLARQVADFLLPKLPKLGGIMTLTDLFCLMNRARGSNLLSPEDLLHAVDMLSELEIGIRTRKFPSGIHVIQLESFDDIKMAKKLLDLCQDYTCLTSLQASRELHISPLLANEHLLAAERAGYLCRDTTLETTRFYPNRFPEFGLST